MGAANKAGKAALKQLLNKLNAQRLLSDQHLPVLFSKVPQATNRPASFD
jgi:hypothetical protein